MKNPSDITFPEVIEINIVAFDSEGFWPHGDKTSIVRWDEILELSLGYWIHSVATLDFFFYGFRTANDKQTIWVVEGNRKFPKELKARFPHANPPAMEDWQDANRDIRAFTLWPSKKFGKPMYVAAKEHWYSPTKLAFKKSSQPGVSVNADKPHRLN